MTMRTTSCPVVHLGKLPVATQSHGNRFEAGMAAIAAGHGVRHLGARLVETPPGKRAWPFHCHHANDEIFVILEGRGMLRFGDEEWPVSAGDVAVCPAGGPERAHQLIAGPEGLRYLAISSMREPEVMEYPDSAKVTVFAGAAPGGDRAARRVSATWRAAETVDYWEGE
ncbi:MAG: cupin domain-containing protein [Pseudomonadota bacterium]